MKVLRKSYDIAHGMKVQKKVRETSDMVRVANGEHEGHEDKNAHEIGL